MIYVVVKMTSFTNFDIIGTILFVALVIVGVLIAVYPSKEYLAMAFWAIGADVFIFITLFTSNWQGIGK